MPASAASRRTRPSPPTAAKCCCAPRRSSRRAVSACSICTSTGCGSTGRASTQRPDYETLLAEIEQGTGLHIALEGVYRWLAFLPSRVEPRVTVANRYFGAFEDGTLKVRGIEARRHDTPTFIRETQLGALEILAEAPDAAAFRRLLPQAIAYARQRLLTLRAGQAPLDELIVTHNLSRRPEEFTVRTPAARVAAELSRRRRRPEPR